MPYISKIQLPGSAEPYLIKDSEAREMIAGGVSFNIVWTLFDYASSTAPTAPKLATIPHGVEVYYNNGAGHATGTLVASADTKGTFYLVYSKTHVGTLDVFDEYATIQSNTTYYWEKIGDTQIDLSNVVTDVTLTKGTKVVLGEDTTFTNSSSSVSFSGGTTDVVLGEGTTFALTSGDVTFGNVTYSSVLGSTTTFDVTEPTITVTPSTTNIKATASGTAVGPDGRQDVVTGYYEPTTDTFVKSVSAETNKNLVVTSITPAGTSVSVIDDVTDNTSKLVTTSIPNVTGNTNVSIPNVTGNTDVSIPNVTSAGSASTWSFTMGSGNEAETLIIGGANSVAPTLGNNLSASKVTLGTNLSASKVTLGTEITAATGALSSTGGGASVMTSTSTQSTNVATVGSSVTVATGETSTTGTGSAVVTGVTVGSSASAITALGAPDTVSALTGVKVTTQPTISLATGATAGTGVISVATGISSASASGTAVSPADRSGVNVVAQMPSASVGTGITVGTNDKVTAIKTLGTATAAAQTITVGTNDKVTAVTDSGTDVNVTWAGPHS